MNKQILQKSAALIFIIVIGCTIVIINQNINANSINPLNHRSEEQRSLSLQEKLRCPSCDGITLDLCELPICREMKKSIYEQMQSGKQNDEIISFFRVRYGNEIVNETNKIIYLVFGTISLIFVTVSIFTLKKFKVGN